MPYLMARALAMPSLSWHPILRVMSVFARRDRLCMSPLELPGSLLAVPRLGISVLGRFFWLEAVGVVVCAFET